MNKPMEGWSTLDIARAFHQSRDGVTFETIDDGRTCFVRYSVASKICAVFYRGKKSTSVWHYHFANSEQRERRIDAEKKAAADAAAYRAKLSADKAAASAGFVNPYKVGDILNTSWGYDQTNVEFFQVVETFGKRGVVLREIQSSIVPGSEGMMCGRVVPIPNKWCTRVVRTTSETGGAPEYADVKPIRKQVANGGGVNIHNANFGHAHKWDGAPCYESHYA